MASQQTQAVLRRIEARVIRVALSILTIATFLKFAAGELWSVVSALF